MATGWDAYWAAQQADIAWRRSREHAAARMTACDNCGGEGGFEVAHAAQSKWSFDYYGGEWVSCPTCAGSGWIDAEPSPLDLDDLDERCGRPAEAA